MPPDLHEFLYEDDVTGLELRVQLRDGEASVIIGPSAKAPLSGVPEQLIVNLLDDELIELHRVIGEEIERNAAEPAADPEGDLVFILERKRLLHRMGCTSIRRLERNRLLNVSGVADHMESGEPLDTCAECAPFGHGDHGQPYIYRRAAGDFLGAVMRLRTVRRQLAGMPATLTATPAAALGDQVFWFQFPDTVHLAGCTLIDMRVRGTLATARGVLAFIERGDAVTACAGCSPLGVTETGETWTYRESTGSFWTAKRRLDLVSEAQQRRATEDVAENVADESSQST